MSDDTRKREGQLARLRALMAKTVDAGCTEAEAKAAAEAVDRLLAVYEIDLDEVTVKEQEIVQLIVKIDMHDVRFSAQAIGAFCDCKLWTTGHGVGIVYFGFKVDTEIAEYLTLMFMRSIERESGNFTMFNGDYDAQSDRGQHDMLHSFKVGMAVRLGERLAQLKSKRDMTQRTSGRDLVLIKSPLIDDAFAELGIKLSAGRSRRSVRDEAAYNAGRGAADSVSIHAGIAGRAAVGGRLR